MIPENLKYTKNHEWVKIEGNTATIGITDYAQHQLGDIVYVEMPEIDTEFEFEESICTVESVKAVADVFSPLKGKILEINEELEDAPEKLNENAYENFIVKIEFEATDDEKLLDNNSYEKYLKELE